MIDLAHLHAAGYSQLSAIADSDGILGISLEGVQMESPKVS